MSKTPALPSEQQTDRQTRTIYDALADPQQRRELQRALPQHVGVDRFIRVALTTIRTTPKLAQCSTSSVLAGLMQAAQLGLEVSGVRGQAYLVPRWNGKTRTHEATFQLGYRGLIDLAARAGITVDVDEIHENDTYDYQRGTDPRLHHRPTLDNPGKTIAYYAVAHFPDSRRSQFVLRSVAQIEAHRDRFRSQEKGGPWDDHFDAMARKTVIRALLNLLPTSVELRNAVVAEAAAAGEPVQATYGVADPFGAIDVPAREIDPATGEITVVDGDHEFDADDPNDPTRGQTVTNLLGEDGAS
jgi:recombination protein RecT